MTTMKTNTAFRLSPSDKAAFRELAQRLQRNQSDTLRVLVRETLAILKEQDARTADTPKKKGNKRYASTTAK